MIKKILLLLTVCLMAQGLWAQNGVGEWRLHVPFVGKNVTTVAEGNQWVYYLAGGNLFRLDKNTSENESLSVINDLSDMTISQIYYNTDRDYLVVVYSNSNIDVILSDGSVVNMPEIKDAVMTSSKVINDVTFASGKIYVATGFGYVVIDDAKFVVKESHMYGEPVVSVAQVGDMLLMSTASAFYYGAASDYHEQLSSFKTGSCKTNCRIWPISESTFFCMTGWTYVATMKRADDGTATFSTSTIIEGRSTTPQATTGGFLLNVPGKGQCFKTGPDGFNPVAVDVTDEVCSGHPSGNNTLWAACEEGLHVVGTETFFRPNAMSIASPFWMTYNKSSDLLYVTPPSANGFFSTTTPMEVNTYNGITWHDVTPEGAPTNGCYWIEFMPDDPNTYFIGTWRDGLLKVVDGEIAFKYDESNSPLKSAYSMHPITSIDRFGNLWVAQPLENEQHPIMVLPAAKAKQPQTTASDWYTPVIDGTYTKHTQRGRFLSTRYSNYDIKVFTDGDYEMPIFFWNSNGDVSISRPDQVYYNSLTDQDGLPFSWTNIMCLAEDLNGTVWMGCSEGVVSFNPAQAFSADFRVNHIKVPRNDGTGMADYLLDGIQVNDIAVDGANRKWLATQSSGLFLVSADGSRIISRFNMTNSPLASNTVYQVCCNPNSNSVYVTTPAGLYEYFSDSSPAESSYDDIYAYPNPVRPDYGGNVTITGMMDNTLIKIADASGFVIRQLKSTGGMATWDCCDQYGERVKTGVYLVLCSQSNGSGEAVVTKIAVVR